MSKPKTSYETEILLNHWVRTIKELYPNTRTENPYQKELESLSDYLTLDEKLLFHDVLHSITLINGHSRQNNQKQLISTHADFMNALQMVTPKDSQLTIKAVEAHEKLQSIFKTEPFTYLEACQKLRISKTSFRRLLKPLMLRKMIIRQEETKHQKAQFQIIPTQLMHETPDQNPFETMQGDWKVFDGFVEF